MGNTFSPYVDSAQPFGFWQKQQTYLRTLLTVLFLICSVSGITHAQIYKWTDANGGTHYGQRPPVQGQAVGEVGTIPLSQRYTPSADTSVQPEQEEAAESTVELFTTSWCGYCRKAREFFDAKGVAFVEYDIEKDPAAAQRKQQIDSRPGVPLALVNGQPIHGYAPSAYEKALR